MRDPRAAIKVEQVRGIFEAIARQCLLEVPGRINPRSVHTELMGLKGRQAARELVKQTAVQIVKSSFEDSLNALGFEASEKSLIQHQDIVDAILLGQLAVYRIKGAERAKLKLSAMFDTTVNHRAGRRMVR
jgi:hypothetical protein